VVSAGQREYAGVQRKLLASIRERHVDASRAKELNAAISDLGEGGMFIEMENPPPKGTIVEAEFRLPGRSAPTKVLGIVRWREKAGPRAGVGVRFAPIGQSERAQMQEILQRGARGATGDVPGAARA
jgi:uncharacterized protein (TIGR02266 family)